MKIETLTLGSRGPYVRLLQSLIARLGYNPGPVDGVFGPQTRQAVIQFQRDFGLTPDGIVGPATWNALERYLRGYAVYTIRPGDTLFNIARRYATTVIAIQTANPGLQPEALRVGQRIVVPYGLPVVFTDVEYTYDIMERDIQELRIRYPFVEVGVAGRSVMGKNLYYIRLGRGPNEVFYNAAHHANEAITSPLVMKFAENFADAFATGRNIRGYNVRDIWRRSSIYIMPMVNPDGVDLVALWPNYTNPTYQQASELNNTGLPLPRVWKANIRGVDLNINYPALWERAREQQLAQGITGPAPREYVGPAPLSEPETRAVADFTREHDFRLVIAYHSQGQVIFWQFQDLAPPEALRIARLFSRASGYAISENPGEAAYAGYKDWFVQEYRRPGYTVEVGRGVNPLPITQLNEIYNRNEEIMLLGAVV